MKSREALLLAAVLLLENTLAAPANEPRPSDKSDTSSLLLDKDDLKTAASGYPDRYADWDRGYSSGYRTSGYGLLDDRYTGYGGYDNANGYNSYDDYSRYGGTGYSSIGYRSGYGGTYGSSGGYGGYGGYSGNGGINSYYGYSNPYYQGASNHLGFGYYRRPSYGNIYNNGVTPSLVTGYRGYSRK